VLRGLPALFTVESGGDGARGEVLRHRFFLSTFRGRLVADLLVHLEGEPGCWLTARPENLFTKVFVYQVPGPSFLA
jgi:hypothetical protein